MLSEQKQHKSAQNNIPLTEMETLKNENKFLKKKNSILQSINRLTADVFKKFIHGDILLLNPTYRKNLILQYRTKKLKKLNEQLL